MLVNGYTAKARTIMEGIAKGNGTTMPQEEFIQPDTSGDQSLGMSSLLKGRVIRKRTLILFVVW